MPRYGNSLLVDALPAPHPFMPRETQAVTRELRIFNQNVSKNYGHVDYLLECMKDDFDVLFIQEPPWRSIRKTVSTTNPEGDDVVGAPKHPDWLYIVRPPDQSGKPRTMAYVHNRLARLWPSLRHDVIDHRDIMVLSLFTQDGTINLLNVYSDDQHLAINRYHG